MQSTITLTDDDIRTAISQLIAERFRVVLDPDMIELTVTTDHGSKLEDLEWTPGKARAVVTIDHF